MTRHHRVAANVVLLDGGAAAGVYNTFIERHIWLTALWTGSVHLTMLDVPHVKMDAGHQDTNSLGALVAQQLHHLRVENSGVITALLHKLVPTSHTHTHTLLSSGRSGDARLGGFHRYPGPDPITPFCPIHT